MKQRTHTLSWKVIIPINIEETTSKFINNYSSIFLDKYNLLFHQPTVDSLFKLLSYKYC